MKKPSARGEWLAGPNNGRGGPFRNDAVDGYQRDVRSWLTFCAAEDIDCWATGPLAVGRWADTHRGSTARTGAKAVSVLRSFYGYAITQGIAVDNPATEAGPFRTVPARDTDRQGPVTHSNRSGSHRRCRADEEVAGMSVVTDHTGPWTVADVLALPEDRLEEHLLVGSRNRPSPAVKCVRRLPCLDAQS